MKIEKLQSQVKRKMPSIIESLLHLKQDECIRLTTAAEGRNFGNIYAGLKKHSKKKLHSRTDGNDLLIWLE